MAYVIIYIYTNVLGRVRELRRFSSFAVLRPQTRKNTCKRCTGATWRSKWPAPACSGCRQCARKGCSSLLGRCQCDQNGRSGMLRCGQCAQKGCPSLLRRRQCAQRGFSSVLFEIAVRKSCSRLHCALSHCTLHCFAPCMDMHGFTLVYIYIYLYKSPRSLLQRLWGLCTFSGPAAHAKTPLFTAREPLWRSKWPLGPARVLLERSEGLFQTCFGATSALEMATLACPGAASALKKAAPACFDAASALKIAILACSGAASALEKSVRACFNAASALKEAARDHYSKVLVSVTLCSDPLYSALLRYVHGYARVHTSIYIYILCTGPH